MIAAAAGDSRVGHNSTCRTPNATPFHLATGPQWTTTLAIPNVPQLAGTRLVLQCAHVPTSAPAGFDLSNGLAIRLGYQ